MTSMRSGKDSIYANPIPGLKTFAFDQEVVSVFPDMINRSVPGYPTIITAIGLLAGRYATTGSHCYDLGCSLGAASLSMRQQIPETCRIIAVDNSPSMAQQCRINLDQIESPVTVDLVCGDIRDIGIIQASVVVLNFTLQFIPLPDRLALLSQIYEGLQPGGILILSEKLAFFDARQAELQSGMHHEFKKAQGYSDLEISQKRTALENVLIPETLEQHQSRLKQAGFDNGEVWFQYFNFASMLAIK